MPGRRNSLQMLDEHPDELGRRDYIALASDVVENAIEIAARAIRKN
jgi:hypothetical protein